MLLDFNLNFDEYVDMITWLNHEVSNWCKNYMKNQQHVSNVWNLTASEEVALN